MRPDITLVTYQKFPQLTPDDQLLAAALARRGVRVRAEIWSNPNVAWDTCPLTLLRSTWDYFHHLEEFHAWLTLASSQTQLANGLQLLRWNADKRYLMKLAANGIPVVPTIVLEHHASRTIGDTLRSLSWRNVVIKPCVGGSSFQTCKFDISQQLAEAVKHGELISMRGNALVQLYIPEVASLQERSLMFFGGKYSHAVRKRAFNGGFATDLTPPELHQATSVEIDFALNVLKTVGHTDYARVDIVPSSSGALLLMELEIIEPALFFGTQKGSADQFADYLLQRLKRPSPTSDAIINSRIERSTIR